MALTPLNSFTTKAANFSDRPNASMSAAQVKAQFDAAPEELRVFVNSLITQLNTDFALKSEIASALLGQILDGSLTDIKLSNATDQVKARLAKVITDLANFIATKGLANGFATLDGLGKLPMTQFPSSGPKVVTGSYTGDNSVNRMITIGINPKAVIIQKDGDTTGASYTNNVTNSYVKCATNGFVVAGNVAVNASGTIYYYTAIE